MRYTLLTVLSAIAAIATGLAQAYEADGHTYTSTCNAYGIALASEVPITRQMGTSVTTARENLYLGKDCDAYHDVLGNGTWCWANGGFSAELELGRLAFGRQELYCEDGRPTPGLKCQC